MAIIPPEFEPLLDGAAQTGPAAQDEPVAPVEHPAFDTELDRFERQVRYEREHPLFGVHPDGVGPTLGQDLGKPNPGRDLDFNNEGYDPPT
ncbi:MAG: hypothetical protein ACXWKY_10705 [Caulobacteraceae bacterium]